MKTRKPKRKTGRAPKPVEQGRRDVLLGLAGLTASGVISCSPEDGDDENLGEAAEALGYTTMAQVGGLRTFVSDPIQAYGPKSAVAGTSITFQVSALVPYTLKIMRLGWDLAGTTKDLEYATVSNVTNVAGKGRWVEKGSYIHVAKSLPPSSSISALTLECWVRPHQSGNSAGAGQSIITQYALPSNCGIGLFLSPSLAPACYFGDGLNYNQAFWQESPEPLLAEQWSHLVATFANGVATLYVNGQPKKSGACSNRVTPGATPLRIGASGDSSGGSNITYHFLDADIAMPVIYSKLLNQHDAQARYDAVMTVSPRQPPQPPSGDPSMVACWPLTEESSVAVLPALATVADLGPNMRKGSIVNIGTWKIGGPSFNNQNLADPTTNIQGHGLRLSQTDMYDCNCPGSLAAAWPSLPENTFSIPTDTPAGVYVARFLYNTFYYYDVPFVVRAAASKPAAPVVVLCNINTWTAYRTFYANVKPIYLSEVPDFYSTHLDGQPTYKVGMNIPNTASANALNCDDAFESARTPNEGLPAFPPDGAPPGGAYGHLLLAERPLHVWLEQQGVDYDVITDLELSQSPTLLRNYRILFIVGHSEYWTLEAYNNVKAFLAGGGKVICASGNTMYWRVAYLANNIIECRKFAPLPVPPNTWGSVQWHTGECFHESDGGRGGLLRELAPFGGGDQSAAALVALETLGVGGDFAPIYLTEDGKAHNFFNSPEVVATLAGQMLGGPHATGHESDTLPSHIPNFTGSDPVGVTVLANALSIPYNSGLTGPNGRTTNGRYTYEANVAPEFEDVVIGSWVDWPRPAGGRVFATGSVGTARTLLDLDGATSDQGMAVSQVFRNAMDSMGVKHRMTALGIETGGILTMNTFDGTDFGVWGSIDTGFDNAGLAFAPAGVMWAPNSLAVVAINAVGELHYYGFDASSGNPLLVSSRTFVGPFTGRPAIVAWGRNRLNIFARRTDGHLIEIKWDGVATWSTLDLGGGVGTDPSVVVEDRRRIGVAVVSTAGNASYKYSVNDVWYPSQTGWQDMGGGGAFNRPPTLHAWNGNLANVFAVEGGTGNVKSKYWDGSNWVPSLTGWQTTIGTAIQRRVAVASFSANQFAVLGTSFTNRVVHTFWDGQANNWGSFTDLGLATSDEVVVSTFRGRSLCAIARGTDNRYYRIVWDGTTWGQWLLMSTLTFLSSPALFSWVSS